MKKNHGIIKNRLPPPGTVNVLNIMAVLPVIVDIFYTGMKHWIDGSFVELPMTGNLRLPWI